FGTKASLVTSELNSCLSLHIHCYENRASKNINFLWILHDNDQIESEQLVAQVHLRLIKCYKKISIVIGATRLFLVPKQHDMSILIHMFEYIYVIYFYLLLVLGDWID
ncbi:hypothetical protein ACJX0J_038244, partial [Zea mays]